MSKEISGWRVIRGDRAGKPFIRLEKGGEWVTTHGRKGIDEGTLMERALIEAYRKDVERADGKEERQAAERLMFRAMRDEQISQSERLAELEKNDGGGDS